MIKKNISLILIILVITGLSLTAKEKAVSLKKIQIHGHRKSGYFRLF